MKLGAVALIRLVDFPSHSQSRYYIAD